MRHLKFKTIIETVLDWWFQMQQRAVGVFPLGAAGVPPSWFFVQCSELRIVQVRARTLSQADIDATMEHMDPSASLCELHEMCSFKPEETCD